MIISRRTAVLGLAGAMLAACAPGAAPITGSSYRAVPNPAFDAWVAGFRQRALSRGISAATFDSAFRGAGYLPDVIERDRNQTESTRTLEDYLAIAASDERVSKGRAALSRHRGSLDAISGRYGVPSHVVTAVWGLESFYGERRGEVPVISATATLAFDGRRGAFFEDQLIAALRILQNGDVTPARMTGSWAGAMGHTQFIPTSYIAYAVDFTGDGRRDIWSNDPTDALASTAAYLGRSGWVRGQPWGMEARLPEGFNWSSAGRGTRRSTASWSAMGVQTADGRALPDHGPAEILPPAGGQGPAFILYRNFSVLLRYNNADSYALGVGHLSDRINGSGPLRASFGPDARGMTLNDRKQLQQRLTAKGYDVGVADGVIGAKTEAAIRAYQRSQGLAETGEPSMELLRRLG